MPTSRDQDLANRLIIRLAGCAGSSRRPACSGPHKELVLVAAEADGRVRPAHAESNDKATLKRFADGQVAPDARVVTDGLASYDADSLGDRPHEAKVQSKAERRENDAADETCHAGVRARPGIGWSLWASRRPASKARRASISGICER